MALGTLLVLATVFLLPPLSVGGLVVWAWRFGKSAGAPRFAVGVAYALAGLAGLTVSAGFALGLVSFTASADGESVVVSDRARHLGEGTPS